MKHSTTLLVALASWPLVLSRPVTRSISIVHVSVQVSGNIAADEVEMFPLPAAIANVLVRPDSDEPFLPHLDNTPLTPSTTLSPEEALAIPRPLVTAYLMSLSGHHRHQAHPPSIASYGQHLAPGPGHPPSQHACSIYAYFEAAGAAWRRWPWPLQCLVLGQLGLAVAWLIGALWGFLSQSSYCGGSKQGAIRLEGDEK